MAKTKTFNINFFSEEEQKRYEGTFTCKKLSVRDMSQQAVKRTQLNGGYHYDADNPGCGIDFSSDRLNAMLAHLFVAVTSSPTWWDLDEIEDIELLTTVYQEVLDFENSFRRQQENSDTQTEQQSSSSQTSGEKKATSPDRSGAVTEVVGGKVQAALEP